MKIVIVGLPYFAAKIAQELSEVDKKNLYVAIDTSAGVWQKLRFVWHIISAKVLYFIGGQPYSGKVLWLTRLLKKKVVMHWVGTDVLNAQKLYKSGALSSELLSKTQHFCEVDWVQKELLEIGIQAEMVQIASFPDSASVPPPLPEKFSILFYMGEGREHFYGIDKLIELAKAFPAIPINIVGASKSSVVLPSNIHLLGWIQDMDKAYRDSVLVLRFPEHDGLSFSVLEALSYGRYVGYIYNFYGTNHIPGVREAHALIKSLLDLHSAGSLGINIGGYEFILKNYRRDLVMRILAEKLQGTML